MATNSVPVYKPDKITRKQTCEPGWARILLRDKRASVISHNPFSIAMNTPDETPQKKRPSKP